MIRNQHCFLEKKNLQSFNTLPLNYIEYRSYKKYNMYSKKKKKNQILQVKQKKNILKCC